MSEVLSFAELRMRGVIRSYFGGFSPSAKPVSVHAALNAVRRQVDGTDIGDEFIISAIEAYGVERGYVLRLDGHTRE